MNQGEDMEYAALIILIALAQYLFFTVLVGLKRSKYGVKAPQTSGHEVWERMFRVQQNTMEQLIIFIPATIAFSMYVSERGVLLPGVLFILSRQLYRYQYVREPDSRASGMALSLISNVILLGGALIGVLMEMT